MRLVEDDDRDGNAEKFVERGIERTMWGRQCVFGVFATRGISDWLVCDLSLILFYEKLVRAYDEVMLQ